MRTESFSCNSHHERDLTISWASMLLSVLMTSVATAAMHLGSPCLACYDLQPLFYCHGTYFKAIHRCRCGLAAQIVSAKQATIKPPTQTWSAFVTTISKSKQTGAAKLEAVRRYNVDDAARRTARLLSALAVQLWSNEEAIKGQKVNDRSGALYELERSGDYGPVRSKSTKNSGDARVCIISLFPYTMTISIQSICIHIRIRIYIYIYIRTAVYVLRNAAAAICRDRSRSISRYYVEWHDCAVSGAPEFGWW